MTAKKEYLVMSHTHWDREWYQCFEHFRLRLVTLMDNLLEIFKRDPQFVFHLDAQTICLEDFLEMRPHCRSEIEQLVRAGRLLVGPWYVQNDFNLCSGEATVRNLLIGSEIAERFGRSEWIAYTPDQFGLVSQLPQIYCGFGMQDTIFGRGYRIFERGEDGGLRYKPLNAECDWIGADGSRVNAVFLKWWYNNAQRFSANADRAYKFLMQIEQAMAPHTSTPYRLLMNGVDHLEAQEDLLPILKALQERLGDTAVIKQSTFREYFDKMRAYLEGKPKESIRGELRYGDTPHVLQGTLSSRPYLKMMNARAQNTIELQLEPLSVILERLTDRAIPYPEGLLNYVWKELLKNHPHDSICGCSTDRVHQDNENRFKRVQECADELIRRSMKSLMQRISRAQMAPNDYLLAVVNTLPFQRSEVVTAEVYPLIKDEIASFELLDENGAVVSYEVLAAHLRNRTILTQINLPGQVEVHDLKIRFKADDLPPSGYRIYRLRVKHGAARFRQDAQAPVDVPEGFVLKNEFLQVAVNPDGTVDLTDLQTGLKTPDLIQLEDVADLGDSYWFVPAKNGKPFDFSTVKPVLTLLESAPQMQSVRLDYVYGAEENHVALTLSLAAGSRRLDVDVVVTNRAINHRLRLLVNTDVQSDDNITAQPFDCIRRCRIPEFPELRQDWTDSNSGLVTVKDAVRQMSVFNEGIYEYEHLQTPRGTIALTLVRATGRIANDPMCTGKDDVEAAPTWAAPENQCLRTVAFRLAIRPGAANGARLMREMQFFQTPLISEFWAADSRKFSGGRACVQDSELQEFFYREPAPDAVNLPLSSSGVELHGDVVFSSLKRAERGRGWILRFFNPSDTETTVEIRFARPVTFIKRANLREEAEGPSLGPVIPASAKKIVTLRFE